MIEILCEICEKVFDGDEYGEENACPGCGQLYSYDEGQHIVLTAEQVALLRKAVNSNDKTDTERFDFLEREGFTVGCQWKNTGWAGGPKWSVYQYASRPLVSFDGETLREAIDRAAAKSEASDNT